MTIQYELEQQEWDAIERAIFTGDWIGYGVCQQICRGLCGWGSWKCGHAFYGTSPRR
jgi:hypothetical protein